MDLKIQLEECEDFIAEESFSGRSINSLNPTNQFRNILATNKGKPKR